MKSNFLMASLTDLSGFKALWMWGGCGLSVVLTRRVRAVVPSLNPGRGLR
jgi:hypothetical protein